MVNIANIGANPSLDLMVAVVSCLKIIYGNCCREIAGTHHKLYFIYMCLMWKPRYKMFALTLFVCHDNDYNFCVLFSAMHLHILVISRKCEKCCTHTHIVAEQIDASGVGFSSSFFSWWKRKCKRNMKIMEINCAVRLLLWQKYQIVIRNCCKCRKRNQKKKSKT